MHFLLVLILLFAIANAFNNFGTRIIPRSKFQVHLSDDSDDISTSNEDSEIPSMKSIRNLEDVPPVTIDSFLPGEKLQPGNIINIILFGYVGYLFIDSIRILIFGLTHAPPPS